MPIETFNLTNAPSDFGQKVTLSIENKLMYMQFLAFLEYKFPVRGKKAERVNNENTSISSKVLVKILMKNIQLLVLAENEFEFNEENVSLHQISVARREAYDSFELKMLFEVENCRLRSWRKKFRKYIIRLYTFWQLRPSTFCFKEGIATFGN